MQTPYFLPTEQILAAMQTAALSGVDVRLMLPERADNWITHLGSRSYLADVMQAGVKVYFIRGAFCILSSWFQMTCFPQWGLLMLTFVALSTILK